MIVDVYNPSDCDSPRERMLYSRGKKSRECAHDSLPPPPPRRVKGMSKSEHNPYP